MTFNLRTNLEEVNEMILKIFEIVDKQKLKGRPSPAKPDQARGPARPDRLRPEPDRASGSGRACDL